MDEILQNSQIKSTMIDVRSYNSLHSNFCTLICMQVLNKPLNTKILFTNRIRVNQKLISYGSLANVANGFFAINVVKYGKLR